MLPIVPLDMYLVHYDSDSELLLATLMLFTNRTEISTSLLHGQPGPIASHVLACKDRNSTRVNLVH
jgi:hypothetical protein